ncbi:MAG TPA: hypothetical protein VFJ74_13980 [Gemmatimonadaceae bacterium]|nr:hypothetical protein [Gemmatimonadaceae bacterium]
MLDPKEQKKGGFGAFAAREQADNDVRTAAEHPAPATPAATPAAAPAPATTKPTK